MKKILSWMFLLLIIASLAGCKKGGETPQAESREYGELRVVSNYSYRGLMLQTAEAQNGYYEFIEWLNVLYAGEETSPWMHTGNIVYTDYATKTRIVLCGTPGCAHNSERCTSYVRFPAGIRMFTNSTGTQLFCMAAGASGGEVYSEDDLGRIYTLNMDGTNRREIYRLQPNENFEWSDTIVADETHLFVGISVTTGAEDGEYTREVREIDLIDGRITPLFELNPLERVVSAFDDTIVTVQEEERDVPQWSDDMTGADAMKGGPTKYYGYSVKDGKTRELADKSDYHAVAAGPYLIFRRPDSDSTLEITRYNLATGEEDVFSNLPTAPPKTYVGVWDYFDGKVTWGTGKEDEGIFKDCNYILDCDTGEYREFTLTFETNMGGVYTRFVPILAEHGDQFLVQADSVESTLMQTNREGIPFVYDYTYRPVYALMSKEDYWNSIPNYTFIEDTVGL